MPEHLKLANRLFSAATSIQGTSLSRSKKTLKLSLPVISGNHLLGIRDAQNLLTLLIGVWPPAQGEAAAAVCPVTTTL